MVSFIDIKNIYESLREHPKQTILILFIMVIIALMWLFLGGFLSQIGEKAASGIGSKSNLVSKNKVRSESENNVTSKIYVGEVKTGEHSTVNIGDQYNYNNHGVPPKTINDAMAEFGLKLKEVKKLLNMIDKKAVPLEERDMYLKKWLKLFRELKLNLTQRSGNNPYIAQAKKELEGWNFGSVEEKINKSLELNLRSSGSNIQDVEADELCLRLINDLGRSHYEEKEYYLDRQFVQIERNTSSANKTNTTANQNGYVIDTERKKIKIASFNIQNSGLTESKDEEPMEYLAMIISKFDVIAIQGMKDVPTITIVDLLQKIKSLGLNYEYLISPPVGRGAQKEQNAYFYNVNSIVAGETYAFDDTVNDLFLREPFIGQFNAKDGILDFVVIAIHIDTKEAISEITSIETAIADARKKFPDEIDFIILGTLNDDCSYSSGTDVYGPMKNSEYYWISNDKDTTSSGSGCTYDRIIITSPTREYYTSYSGIYRYDREMGLNLLQTNGIFFHYPVWASFYVDQYKKKIASAKLDGTNEKSTVEDLQPAPIPQSTLKSSPFGPTITFGSPVSSYEVIKACKKDLQEYDRDKRPLDWAKTQIKLGNALQEQSAHQEHQKSEDLLEEAIRAYRMALLVYNRDNQPLEWARTQMKLGKALQDKGDYEVGQKRKAYLDSAFEAFRKGAPILSIGKPPKDWTINKSEPVRVVGVTDGETIAVLTKANQVIIRLYGIDCPEERQAFALEAEKFTSDMVSGKQVTIKQVAQDRSARSVAWVYVDGKCLNEELVKAGLAWYHSEHSDSTILDDLETRARLSKRGLWADPYAIPPWEFQKL